MGVLGCEATTENFSSCWAILRRRCGNARDLEGYVRHGIAAGGEDIAADHCVLVPDCGVKAVGKARIGATESVRPGGAADAFEYRAERHHWGGQQCDRRNCGCDFAAGG